MSTSDNVEVYNMTQAQRDAAHIAALQRQVQDLSEVVKALACSKTHVSIGIHALEMLESTDVKELIAQHGRQAASQAAEFILKELMDRGDLYRRLANYEQWFYAKTNYTTRHDALRSTMTTAR